MLGSESSDTGCRAERLWSGDGVDVVAGDEAQGSAERGASETPDERPTEKAVRRPPDVGEFIRVLLPARLLERQILQPDPGTQAGGAQHPPQPDDVLFVDVHLVLVVGARI